ncbi:hypothetical protein HispidOSU_020185, partial [Sigmodon hispidus]
MEDPLLGSCHLLREKDVPRNFFTHREPMGSLLVVVLIIKMLLLLLIIINIKVNTKPAAQQAQPQPCAM